MYWCRRIVGTKSLLVSLALGVDCDSKILNDSSKALAGFKILGLRTIFVRMGMGGILAPTHSRHQVSYHWRLRPIVTLRLHMESIKMSAE